MSTTSSQSALLGAVLVALVAGCQRPSDPAQRQHERPLQPQTATQTPPNPAARSANSTEPVTPANTASPRTAPFDLPPGRIVDLTHPYDENTIYWPTEKGFQLETQFDGLTERGYFYAAKKFTSAEHGGTHLDAPYHFYREGETVEKIPLARLMGEAAVIDVVEKCHADADYEVQIADLRGWEAQHGRPLSGKIVLLWTGHSRFWNDRAKYLGTAETGPAAVADLHFPGLAPDAARWLAQHRPIKVVGIDTPSIDFGPSRLFETHRMLFEHNIPALENVAHLDQLPEQGALVIALPMKIASGTGAPTRIVGIVPEGANADEHEQPKGKKGL